MTISRTRKLRVTIILLLGSFLSVHLCFWLLPGVFETWNSLTIDQLFVLRSKLEHFRPVYDNTVVHVDFNNTSIERLQNLYLNRSHFTQLVRNLDTMGVSAQVFDFIFAARLNDEEDLKLTEAVRNAGNVYLGLAFELRKKSLSTKTKPAPSPGSPYILQTSWNVTLEGNPKTLYVAENPVMTFPELAFASRGLGSLSVKFDRDGVLRRVPLIVRYENSYYPLLPLRVVCDYLGISTDKIILHPGKHIILPASKKPGSKTPHDIVIPIDREGNMIVNYLGPWERMDHYDFADILRASEDRDELEIWAEELGGKIVVISDVSTGSTDVGPVPTDANFPLSGVHANIINDILTESFLRGLSEWEMLCVEILILAALFFLTIRFSSLYFSFGTVLVAASFMTAAFAGFFYGGVTFNIVRPLIMIGFAMVSIVVYRYINEEKEKMETLRQRDFIRQTFGRYLSNEVVEDLLESPDGLKMSGENREVTFLISDLRGFTAMTSKLSPNEVIEIMNRYFESMLQVIVRYRGTVNEFTGDGILAFFGAPLNAVNDPERAVACAVEMQNKLREVNAEQRRLKQPELAMGIGINTGDVVVGNIGSEKRASYGAVGTPINTAFRIESFTVGGQVLISPTTFSKVESLVKLKGKKEVRFKGIDRPVCLYDVVGIGGVFQVFLPEEKPESLTRLDTPLTVECFPLEGKAVSPVAIGGQITGLGENSAEVVLVKAIEANTNLRILLSVQGRSGVSELYAKVIVRESPGPKRSDEKVLLQFTSMPDETREYLDKRRLGV